MKRTWTIIGVADVPQSARWYPEPQHFEERQSSDSELG